MESNSRRPTIIDDLAALRTPGDPQMSPDGTRIAFTVQTTALEKNKYQTHIWVVGTDSEGDAPWQWTQGAESESQPRWSPDGKWLAFVSGREDKVGQIYLLPTSGGEAIKATELPSGSISQLAWSPDSARIAFTFRPQDEERTEKAADERKKTNRSTPPREITRRHYREDGAGWVPQAPCDLYILDVANRTVTQLTHGENGDQESFCWSPTGDEIAVVRNTASAPDLMPNATGIFVISASIEDVPHVPARKLNAPPGPKYSLAWSPEGQRIAYLGHDDPEEVWGVRNVHVWTVGATRDSGEAARDLTPDWDVTCGSTLIGDVSGGGASGPVWGDGGQSVLVLASDRGGVELYRIALASDTSLEGRPSPVALTQGKHAVVGFTVDTARTGLALLIAAPTDAGDLFTMPTNASTVRRVTSLNEDLLRTLDMPVPIEFAATAPDGQSVPCWAILPPTSAAAAAGPHPTILYIHGGPHLMYGHTLFHEYQALASAGYTVLFPNPRGSKGYGEAWTGAIRGNWGEPAQADCLACVDYAIGQGWSDPDRLGIAGGSYGGYLTAWILGHSDRFAAGVAERGVFNMQSMAGTCDFVWRDHDYFRADTTADPADYLRNSPLTYANDITTPLLIIHSEGDLRCPIEQAEQLFAALNMRGRDVAFLRYGPEASHGLSRSGPPDLRLDRQRRIHAYFDRYLKAGSAAP